MTDSSQIIRGSLALSAAVLIWSSWAIVSRVGMKSDFSPWDLAMLRFAVAGTVMLPVLIRMGWGGVGWRSALLITLGAGPGYVAFAYGGLQLTPASHGATLTAGMLPLFTSLLAWSLGLERVSFLKWAAVVLLVVAAGCFFADGFNPDDVRDGNTWKGDLLLLGAPMMWATFTITIRSQNIAKFRATAIVAVLGLAIYAPFYLLLGDPRVFVEAGWQKCLFHGLFHGLIVMVLALPLFVYAVHAMGPVITTLATATVPGITTLAAAAILDEPLTALSIAGVLLDGAGIALVALAVARSRAEAMATARLEAAEGRAALSESAG